MDRESPNRLSVREYTWHRSLSERVKGIRDTTVGRIWKGHRDHKIHGKRVDGAVNTACTEYEIASYKNITQSYCMDVVRNPIIRSDVTQSVLHVRGTEWHHTQ